MHHLFNFGHGTRRGGQGTARFRALLSMKGKKVVPRQQLAIMARVNKVQCSMGGHQSSEFEGVGCKDVMV